MAKEKKSDTQQINLDKSKSPVSSDTQQINLNRSKNSVSGGTQQVKTSRKSGEVKKPKLWRVILGGILLTILFAAGAGALGYKQGISDRLNAQNEEILSEAALQYQYGVQQMNNGNYELARTHFEYVLDIYPEFPGIQDKYTETMVKIAQSSMPTATPVPTSTPDNRGVEALFAQAQQEVQNQQWAAAVNTLEALRNTDYSYRTIEVDGLYYIALRYRAIEMILTEGNLEEGMYYLSVLEDYAPLDRDAVSYANVVRLYLTGASYWELDWAQVVSYFEQLYAAMPSLYDGSMTATDRYYYALIYYGDQLMDEGDECKAEDYYSLAMAISNTDTLQSKYNEAYKICHPPTAVPTETVAVTEEPTEEVTEEPTEETTEEPTATATEDTGGGGDGGDGGDGGGG